MILTDEEVLEIWNAMEMPGVFTHARAIEAAVLQKLSEQEPVAIVGDVYQLLWFGSSPIAAITSKHGIKVGDKLYAYPAQPKSEWISVEDRLPEASLSVLVARFGKDFVTKTCHDGKEWLLESIHFPVTHWQHLPSPPEAK